MGFTPRLVAGCWVGGDDRDIHFNNMAMGQGATMALPIFAYYMQKVYANQSLGYSEDEHFEIPANFDPCSVVDDMEPVGEGDEPFDENVTNNDEFE